MTRLLAFLICLIASFAAAEGRYDALPGSAMTNAEAVWRVADELWPEMPDVRRVADMAEPCGAVGKANPRIFYCTTPNVIFIARQFEQGHQSAYEMAHILGHALQVRHGIADIALREVRRRPEEEDALRSMVTRQVECLAGFLVAEAGLNKPTFADFSLSNEPFTGAHWGRDPVRVGPQVSIGLEPRAASFARGFAARRVDVCAVEEIPIEPILDARRQ